MGAGGTGRGNAVATGVGAASPGRAPAVDLQSTPAAPRRERVAVILIGDDAAGELSSFATLYGVVVDEIGRVGTVDVDPGGDLVSGADEWINGCLTAPVDSLADANALLCISQVAQVIQADYEFIIKVNKIGEEGDVSLLIVDNATADMRGHVRSVGSVSDICKAARRLVHQAFDPKPKPGPTAEPAVAATPDLNLLPAPPSATPDAFVSIPAPPPTAPASDRWKIPAILGGSAVASAAAAVILGVVAKRKEGQAQRELRRDPAFADYREAERFALSANIAFGLSALLGGISIVAALRGGPEDDRGP